MGRPRIVDVNYYEFKKHVQRAADLGCRIEKSDKERWTAYLKENKINEVAMLHTGRSRYDEVKGVIINDGGPWEGFYVYNADEEAVLKWERMPD